MESLINTVVALVTDSVVTVICRGFAINNERLFFLFTLWPLKRGEEAALIIEPCY